MLIVLHILACSAQLIARQAKYLFSFTYMLGLLQRYSSSSCLPTDVLDSVVSQMPHQWTN